MTEQACGTCRYWKMGWPGERWGVCRRRAPLPQPDRLTRDGPVPAVLWPKLYPNEWCGEWQSEESEPPDRVQPMESRH